MAHRWGALRHASGGVASPVLANLFLHYALDLWMARRHPELPWCRYADDGLVRCRSEQEAKVIMAELQLRLRKNTGQVEKPHLLREYRKDIARLETFLKQKNTPKAAV